MTGQANLELTSLQSTDHISDLYGTMCMSLFIQQPQHHPSTPPFALHPVSNTINPQCQCIGKYSQALWHKENSRAGRRKERMEEGGEQEKKRGREKKIRLWWSTTFPKLAGLLAEGQWRETMQRCADPGIYRRPLEHWAIGRRVSEGRGGVSALFSKAKHRGHDGALCGWSR